MHSQSAEIIEPTPKDQLRFWDNEGAGRCALFHAMLLTACLMIGCNSRDDVKTESSTDQTPSTAIPSVDVIEFERTRRLKEIETSWNQGDIAAASQLVKQQLLLTPEDSPTLLLAGKIAAAGQDQETAIELIMSIPLESEISVEATELLVKWYLESKQYENAVARLQVVAEQSRIPLEFKVAFRRQLWALLNRLGRRQQASFVADQLCRSGYFGREVLISLLRRGDAFHLL